MKNNLNPFVTVVDFRGNTLSDAISDFSYKFSEEEDDACDITFDGPDPKMADRAEFQEGKLMVVKWGYIGGSISRERTVFIFDTKTDYTEEGIKLSLTCHEKFALAKMDSVSNKNLRQLKKDTPIIFSPEVLSNLSLEVEKGSPELNALLKDNNINLKTVKKGNAQGGNTVVTYYNGNLSTFQNLRSFLDKTPGGPYVIDSRDNSVTIRTRNFAQPSTVSYTYGGDGNALLKFSPETKNRSKGSNVNKIKVTSWDRKKKQAVTHQITASDDTGVVLALQTPLKDWTDISGIDKPIPMNWFLKDQPGALARLGIKRGDRAANTDKGTAEQYQGKLIVTKGKLPTGPQNVVKLAMGADYGSRTSGEGKLVAIDNTAVYKKKFEVLNDSPLPTKSIISNEDPTKAKAHAENHRRSEELKNNPATGEVEGNPILETGQIITIKGVANKHRGNYYIKACEHKIGGNEAYKTTLSAMVRQGVNRKTHTITSVQGESKRTVNTSKGPEDAGTKQTVKIKSKPYL
jgi:hypothetical protein